MYVDGKYGHESQRLHPIAELCCYRPRIPELGRCMNRMASDLQLWEYLTRFG